MNQVQKADVLRALRTRYDFISAQHVLAEALKEANIKDRSSFTSAEVDELCQKITGIGVRVQKAVALVKKFADNGGQGSTTPSSGPSSASKKSETKQAVPTKKDASSQPKKAEKKTTSLKTKSKGSTPATSQKKTVAGQAGKSAKRGTAKNTEKKPAKNKPTK